MRILTNARPQERGVSAKSMTARRALAALAFSFLLPSVSLAQSAGQSAPQGPTETREVYGEWSVRCRDFESANAQSDPQTTRLCELNHAVNVRRGGAQAQNLLQIAIGQLPGQDTYKFVLRTPLNMALREAIGIHRDPGADTPLSAPVVQLTYVTCDQMACIADVDLDLNALKTLGQLRTAVITMVDRTGTRAGIPLSFNGYQAALEVMAED